VVALAAFLGLYPGRAFYADAAFWLAVLAGVLFWGGLAVLGPVAPLGWQQLLSWQYGSLVLWQPGWEELVFRGALQGYARQQAWGQHYWCGVSTANVVVSVLFMAGHWLSHPPLWALGVFLPALLFGWMRDHYDSLYPALVLHALYNAGYFWLTGFPAV
jgi:hypothetical protein